MIDPNDFDIPIDVNDDVIRWMKYSWGLVENITAVGWAAQHSIANDDSNQKR